MSIVLLWSCSGNVSVGSLLIAVVLWGTVLAKFQRIRSQLKRRATNCEGRSTRVRSYVGLFLGST